MPLSESELILNPDGSIYHLNLLPEDISTTIITVGDPDRVLEVSKHFDSIEIKKGKREFLAHTGHLNSKRITALSTGIGTDNIDIVINELDALVNVDFRTREVKSEKTALDFIRVGTSGAIQPEIPVDSFVLSETAIGLDGLLHFYDSDHIQEAGLSKALHEHLENYVSKIAPYAANADANLTKDFNSNRIRFGTTLTNSGFYGPQGRKIRFGMHTDDYNDQLASFRYNNVKITNLEMETAGIYGLAKLMGHRAISLNAILANRATRKFSKNASRTIDELIQYCLEKLTT